MGWQDVDDEGQPSGKLLPDGDVVGSVQYRATIGEAGVLYLARWTRSTGGRWETQHSMTVPPTPTVHLSLFLIDGGIAD